MKKNTKRNTQKKTATTTKSKTTDKRQIKQNKNTTHTKVNTPYEDDEHEELHT